MMNSWFLRVLLLYVAKVREIDWNQQKITYTNPRFKENLAIILNLGIKNNETKTVAHFFIRFNYSSFIFALINNFLS